MADLGPQQSPMDDAECVDRARDGDDRAFRVLVERYSSTVAGVAIRMLGPGDEADDVGQETFIRFHRALGEFRGDSALATYLTRIAMNLSLNALKRRRRDRQRHTRLEPAAFERLPGGDDPSLGVERSDTAARLEAALATLNPDQRAVVVLRLREGRPTREVAEVLGVPQGTVMSRLKRGLAKLREELESDEPT